MRVRFALLVLTDKGVRSVRVQNTVRNSQAVVPPGSHIADQSKHARVRSDDPEWILDPRRRCSQHIGLIVGL